MKVCCFIGHRDYTCFEQEIQAKINELIKNGVTEFYSGGMGYFDKICETNVKKQTKKQ